MPTIAIDEAELVVTLERNERRWGLLSDLRVPVSSISAVEVAVEGQRYRTILVGSDEAERVADQIRAAAGL